MSAFSCVTSVNGSCDEALPRLRRALAARGLRALETFDLQDARAASADCTCPHHGTDDCDCQMLVLMVYGEATAPTTLMLHGNDGQIWFSVLDHPEADAGHVPDALIAAAIEESLQDLQSAHPL